MELRRTAADFKLNFNQKQSLTRLELGIVVFPLHILLKISLFNSASTDENVLSPVQSQKHGKPLVRKDFICFDKLCDVMIVAIYNITPSTFRLKSRLLIGSCNNN